MSACTTIIKITRKDTSEPFYYESDNYKALKERISDFMILHRQYLIVNYVEISKNGLEFTMNLVYENEELQEKFRNAWIAEFPQFVEDREQYCKEKNHILEIKTEIL